MRGRGVLYRGFWVSAVRFLILRGYQDRVFFNFVHYQRITLSARRFFRKKMQKILDFMGYLKAANTGPGIDNQNDNLNDNLTMP